jgi:biopolymer transport protein TolR
MQIGGSDELSPVINVTPLIDVLLVLLIIFMLLPHRSTGLPSEAPQSPLTDQPALPNPRNVVVRIQKDRSLVINSEPLVPADLEARLKFLFASRPEGVLFVEGAPELDFADVATVIDVARGAGVDRIGLLTGR